MLDNRLLVVMRDAGEDKSVRIVDTIHEARDFNEKKFGVFWTVNGFKDNRRVKENLIRINAWAVDIDNIDKKEQKKLIEKSPLPPSLVIESKNGYHVYFFSKDANPFMYESIMMDRLIPFFKADKKARDLCRILRVPGFYHWKNEEDPFLIKCVWDRSDLIYTEQQITNNFRINKKLVVKREISVDENYDNLDALEKLSGKPEVSLENYTFRKNISGYQIIVNGKSTSSWIDKNGKIGSYEKGGPTWIQWLQWYGYSREESIKIGENYGIKKV